MPTAQTAALANLRKFLAPEFVFGVGARHLTGRYALNLGMTKVLVVSDPGLKAVGWTDEIINGLHAIGLQTAVTLQITPNPRAHEVMAGARFYNDNLCDGIIAVGGGSVMDAAKGIGVVVSNHRNIEDFEGIDKVISPAPPLICIPTTAGTSADVSQFSIIVHPEKPLKMAIISKAVVPDFAVIDPEMTATMDAYLTACTGIDALVHAVEAFVSLASGPITDMHALEAIRLVRHNLLAATQNLDDMDLRTAVMQGSLQAGLAFSNTSLGAVHAMAHSLGGSKDLPHGECNALLLEHVVAFNFPEATERYRKIGEALGLDLRGMTDRHALQAIFSDIQSLKQQVGIYGSLRDRGIGSHDVPDLASNAFADACIVTNPRRPKQEDIQAIFSEAM